jgi:hypothetical protein
MIREVFPNLFCGDANAYPPAAVMENWAVVHACKEPHHRAILGYTGRGAPKDDPEYLWAERGNRLALNIVDAPKPEFFDKGMIDKALDFIDEKLKTGMKILVHCNEGKSRSTSICLLYIVSRRLKLSGVTLEQCEAEFKKTYPEYMPGDGIRGFMQQHWDEYIK